MDKDPNATDAFLITRTETNTYSLSLAGYDISVHDTYDAAAMEGAKLSKKFGLSLARTFDAVPNWYLGFNDDEVLAFQSLGEPEEEISSSFKFVEGGFETFEEARRASLRIYGTKPSIPE